MPIQRLSHRIMEPAMKKESGREQGKHLELYHWEHEWFLHIFCLHISERQEYGCLSRLDGDWRMLQVSGI